ncbi:MAG: hypothetical protein ACR2GB_07015 [Nocardioidaceae bacterium]
MTALDARVRAVAAAVAALTLTLMQAASGPLAAAAASYAAGAAGSEGYCQESEGVTVVADFRQLGSDIVVRCADWASGDTGVDTLVKAGLSPEGTRQSGLAFICRIAGMPSAEQTLVVNGQNYHETCTVTPPTSAYWGYWHASDGGSWTYSTVGAAGYQTTPGSFEGYAFSLNDASAPPPGVVPTLPVPVEPSPTPQDPTQPSPTPSPSTAPEPPSPSTAPEPSPSSSPGDNGGRTSPPSPSRVSVSTSAQPSSAPPATPTASPSSSTGLGSSESEASPSQSSQSAASPGNTGKPSPASKAESADRGDDKAKNGKRHKPAAQEPAEEANSSSAISDDENVTGELPSSAERDADGAAGSGTTTLVGAGVVAILAIGAAVAAWRRSHPS